MEPLMVQTREDKEQADPQVEQNGNDKDVFPITVIDSPEGIPEVEETRRGCCQLKRPFSLKVFCKKYFWEGQAVHSKHREKIDNLPSDASLYQRLMIRHRYVVAAAIPATLWWIFLVALFVKQNAWHLFKDKYHMTLTMIFGSTVAGATCEGGGAVAFPVMTLAFKISPVVARDFSLFVQGVGMTSASFSIWFMKVKIEKRAIMYCSAGAFVGLLIGFEAIDPYLEPAHKKIGFVSLFFAFAFALFLLNWNHKRRVFTTIPDFKPWKAAVLVATGFVGGMFTAVGGSGLDICCFSILTLLFRVTEKTATPTSVVLMAFNSNVGLIWRAMIQQQITMESVEYIAVCAPVTVIAAPVGSVIGTHFHRLVLAGVVYILDTVSLATAFAVVPMTTTLWIETSVILVFGFLFFFGMSKLGQRHLDQYNEKERLELEEKGLLKSVETTIVDKEE